MSSKAKIEEILTAAFNPSKLVVTDDSASHAGHNPAAKAGGTHFSIDIVAASFEGKTPIQRHRMVYQALQDEFEGGLHALSIQASA